MKYLFGIILFFSYTQAIFCHCEVDLQSGNDSLPVSNPLAIKIIQTIIEHKNENRIENTEAYQFEKYQESFFSISNILEKVEKSKTLQKYRHLLNDMDVSEFTGKPVLTISRKEILSDEYRKKERSTEKSIIIAEKYNGLENNVVSESFDAIWDEAFKNVNIFDDEIEYLFKRFPGPLSSSKAFNFYRYYLNDTVEYKGKKLIEIKFRVDNPKNFGFNGSFYVLPEYPYPVEKIKLETADNHSFNFVHYLLIEQYYNQLPDGLWAKSLESTSIEFDSYKFGYWFYAKRTSSYKKYSTKFKAPFLFDFPGDTYVLKDAEMQPDSFWVERRHFPMKVKPKEVQEAEEEFIKVPFFKTLLIVSKVITSGYVQTHGLGNKDKFDIGPISTIFSGNEIEGMRFRLGGATTANLSKYLFFNGYVAYGTKDGRFKYAGAATWAPKGKKEYNSPYGINEFSVRYRFDMNVPGEQFLLVDKDNALLSIKHGNDDKMTYQKKGILSYEKDDGTGGLAFKVWTHYQNERATGNLHFLKENIDGSITDVGDYTSSEIGFRIRYSHNNVYYRRKDISIPIVGDAPSFYLTYRRGIKGYLDGGYNYAHLDFSVRKIFWLNSGNIDVLAKTGKVWGSLPFPLLALPNANQTYMIQPESFGLMKPIEFVNDKYVEAHITCQLNGIIFGQIPYINRFNIREIIAFRTLFGGLSDNNNPLYNKNLFLFPDGSRKMTNTPYLEASIGIGNIFKVLRIDYVRRLTYLNDPNISQGGVRFGLYFSF